MIELAQRDQPPRPTRSPRSCPRWTPDRPAPTVQPPAKTPPTPISAAPDSDRPICAGLSNPSQANRPERTRPIRPRPARLRSAGAEGRRRQARRDGPEQRLGPGGGEGQALERDRDRNRRKAQTPCRPTPPAPARPAPPHRSAPSAPRRTAAPPAPAPPPAPPTRPTAHPADRPARPTDGDTVTEARPCGAGANTPCNVACAAIAKTRSPVSARRFPPPVSTVSRVMQPRASTAPTPKRSPPATIRRTGSDRRVEPVCIEPDPTRRHGRLRADQRHGQR
jgi:hypothetical protein